MTKKPVPLQVKLLLPVLGAMLFSAAFIFPSFLSGVIACGRGRLAREEGRYSTAIKEYEQALRQFPDNASVIAGLAISYFHNEKMEECGRLLDHISGKRVSGRLSRQVNEIIAKMDGTYYESGELAEALKLYGREELEKTALKLEAYLKTNENDVMGIFHLANINFDAGRYEKAEKLYIRVLELEPEFYSAHLNLAAVYRKTGRLEKAVESCNKVLSLNKEHPQAFVALSKIEFGRGNPAAGLDYAVKAYEYDSSDTDIIANLCLAYHYNGMTGDRDELLDILSKKNYYGMPALQSVIEGSVSD